MTSVIVAPPVSADDIITLPRTSPKHRSSSSTDRVKAFARPRLVLFGVLAIITVLAIRMIAVNSAFLDEATYLSAGQVIWHNWFHGGPDMKYSTYFSGSPHIYPVIAAVADKVGGLYAARVFSLICILVTLCLLDGTTRRIYGSRAAGWATAVFATVEGTQYLAAFATYDAMALMLLALAVWSSLRYLDAPRDLPHGGLYVGVALLALANATKYATALYDPVVIGIVALAYARRYGWVAGRRIAIIYAAILGSLIGALLAAGGSRYATGINYTTLKRTVGTDSVGVVLERSAKWVGVIAVVALIGLAVRAIELRRSKSRSAADLAGFAMLAVLTSAVFLAPLEQAHVHTLVSLNKHVAFGAWFTAIAVGRVLSRFTGSPARKRNLLRWAPAVAFVIPLAVVGQAQASRLHNGWPNATLLTRDMKPYVEANDHYILMDDSEVAEYYLGSSSDPRRWSNTYFLAYQPPGSDKVLTGVPAYESAIAHDHFGIVALNFGVQGTIDRAVQRAVHLNHHYRYLGSVKMTGPFGYQTYVLWIDYHATATP